MNRGTRNQLLAVVIVALVVVLALWYAATRQVYYQAATLAQIEYAPVAGAQAGAPPYLTFTFSAPLDPAQVAGTTAVLKSFAIGAASPTPLPVAAPFLALLMDGPGGKGPAPFVPSFAPENPHALTTNTLPGGATAFTRPMVITGSGVMWFAVPKGGPARARR